MRTLRILVAASLVAVVLTASPAAAQSTPVAPEASLPTAASSVSFSNGGFEPLVPARVLDTRSGNGAPQAKLAADATIDVQIAGRGGVPATGAGSVVLNVTADKPANAGWVTVYPTGATRPLASNLNFTAGQTIPNLVVAKLGTDGRITIHNSPFTGPVDLIADIAGWFPESSGFEPLVPARVLDTRSGNGAPQAKLAADATIDVQIAGRGGVPATGAGSVVLNVTADKPANAGWVTVYPTGATRPLASNLNFTAGQTIPNLVVAKLGTDGRITIHNSPFTGPVDLIADIAGWFPESSGFEPLVPARVLDTRSGNGAPQAKLAADATIDVQIAGRGGVPATGAGSVVLNVTADKPANAGWVTVYPTGATRPLASNLNFTAGQTIPNLVVAKIGTDGRITIHNSPFTGPVDLIADIAGWFPDDSSGTSTLDLLDGTVLAGPGDISSVVGDSDTGATVVLSSTADIPAVGDHFAASHSNVAPSGISGLVTAVVANPDGTTTITLTPANLQDMFANVVIDGDLSGAAPLGLALPNAPLSTPGANQIQACSGSVGAPIVSLDNLGGNFEFDMLAGNALAVVTADANITWGIPPGEGISCSISLGTVIIVVGPATFELEINFTYSASSATTSSLTTTVPLSAGLRVEDGVPQNLTSADILGSSTEHSDPDISIAAAVGISAKPTGKILGIAGLAISIGPRVSLTVSSSCTELKGDITIKLSAEIGRWGIKWSWTLADFTLLETTLYRKGCGDTAWIGSIDVTHAQDLHTKSYYDTSGNLGYTRSYATSHSYRLESTETSLLNTTYSAGERPDVSMEARSLSTTFTYAVNGQPLDQYPCNATYTIARQTPWQYSTQLWDAALANRVFAPADGDLVYLRLITYLYGYEYCANGQLLGSGGYTAGLNAGENRGALAGVSSPCLTGAVHRSDGYCFIPVTISEGGTRLRFNGTLSGIHTREGVSAGTTSTIVIDLRKVND